MMNNIYKITKKGLAGSIYIMYKASKVSEILFQLELNADDQKLLKQLLAMQEDQLELMRPHFDCVLLKPRTVADKAAAFCMLYRAHRNTAYTAKKNERANLADVTMSDKLLEVYFTHTEFPLNYAKTINDYIRHYNYIRDLATNGKPVKNSFPDIYDREYERGLEGEKLMAYWQHLNKAGWRKEDGTWTKR